jgi:hypothetical protein
MTGTSYLVKVDKEVATLLFNRTERSTPGPQGWNTRLGILADLEHRDAVPDRSEREPDAASVPGRPRGGGERNPRLLAEQPATAGPAHPAEASG